MEFSIPGDHSIFADTLDYHLLDKSGKSNDKFKNHIEKFKSLQTSVERVDFGYKALLEIYPNRSLFIRDSKMDIIAIQLRLIGNDCFRKGDFRTAHDHYTKSIAFAESPSVLALAYANRSAVLARLNLHKQCLMDIERAFANGYPDELKPKLIKRQEHSKSMNLPKFEPYEPVPKIPESEKNPLIECAKNCVKIERNETYGRHIVATRDIDIGEVIAVEKPYAATVLTFYCSHSYVYCHECFELCYNLIPCNSCTLALYCSNSCKEKALATYHKYECPILRTLYNLFMSAAKPLALKLFLLAKNDPDFDHVSNLRVDYNNDFYRSDRLKEVFNLENHDSKDAFRLLDRSIAAAALFDLLKKHTSFLRDGVSEDKIKDYLLNFVLISNVNSMPIEEKALDPKSDDLKLFGCAIYPFTSLFNHSCWQNVYLTYHGPNIVLRAINKIKKGEQCFISYGQEYWTTERDERQNHLASTRFFTCNCRACEENWPLLKDLLCEANKDYLILGEEETDAFSDKLANDDLQAAKDNYPSVLTITKKIEAMVPPGKDFKIKFMLKCCYDLFGNKRLI